MIPRHKHDKVSNLLWTINRSLVRSGSEALIQPLPCSLHCILLRPSVRFLPTSLTSLGIFPHAHSSPLVDNPNALSVHPGTGSLVDDGADVSYEINGAGSGLEIEVKILGTREGSEGGWTDREL